MSELQTPEQEIWNFPDLTPLHRREKNTYDPKAKPKPLYLREVRLFARTITASPLQLVAPDIISNLV